MSNKENAIPAGKLDKVDESSLDDKKSLIYNVRDSLESREFITRQARRGVLKVSDIRKRNPKGNLEAKRRAIVLTVPFDVYFVSALYNAAKEAGQLNTILLLTQNKVPIEINSTSEIDKFINNELMLSIDKNSIELEMVIQYLTDDDEKALQDMEIIRLVAENPGV